jgi:hypothetical protein
MLGLFLGDLGRIAFRFGHDSVDLVCFVFGFWICGAV